jgi:hypothetical protein
MSVTYEQAREIIRNHLEPGWNPSPTLQELGQEFPQAAANHGDTR